MCYPCPMCGNIETILADFNQAYCAHCDFYWHFWLKPEEIEREIQEHIRKRACG